eukprot:902070-Rhodomonas_salina.4
MNATAAGLLVKVMKAVPVPMRPGVCRSFSTSCAARETFCVSAERERVEGKERKKGEERERGGVVPGRGEESARVRSIETDLLPHTSREVESKCQEQEIETADLIHAVNLLLGVGDGIVLVAASDEAQQPRLHRRALLVVLQLLPVPPELLSVHR